MASLVWAGLASSTTQADEGVVALESTPACDFFVVETNSGFTLLEWYGGAISIWQGDRVFGDLSSYGFEDIVVEGRGDMRVYVEDYMMGRDAAEEFFYSKC